MALKKLACTVFVGVNVKLWRTLVILPLTHPGFILGGKVTIYAGGESTPFDAVSIVHPA